VTCKSGWEVWPTLDSYKRPESAQSWKGCAIMAASGQVKINGNRGVDSDTREVRLAKWSWGTR